jgi:hypothetical protein
MGTTTSARLYLTRNVRNIQPKVGCGSNRIQESVQVARLAKVTVGMEFISIANVSFRIGSCEHRNRNQAQIRVAFHLAQYVPGVRFRQIEIQKDKRGLGSAGVLSLASQKSQRFFPIDRRVNRNRRLDVSKRLAHQAHIPGIVLDNEYVSVPRQSILRVFVR